MQRSFLPLHSILSIRMVNPRRRSATRGRISFCTESVEQRLLLSGTEPPTILLPPSTLFPPTDPVGTTTTPTTTTTTTVNVSLVPPITITVTTTASVDPQAMIDAMWAANTVEREALKLKIERQINNWSEQQNNLITDSVANATAALDKLINFLDGNPKNLKGLTNDAVNLVWAGSAYTGVNSATIGVTAVVFGIAVNKAIDAVGTSEELREQIKTATTQKVQEFRNQVAKVKQEWQDKTAAAYQDAETRKDTSIVPRLWQEVQTSLPCVEGAAPKPLGVSGMYKQMLIAYANSQGWQGLIKGDKNHQTVLGTYYYINPQASLWQTANWIGWTDVNDIINELNAVNEAEN